MAEGIEPKGQGSEESGEGFPGRLRKVMGAKSIRAFARESGLSDTVLRQYLAGQSEPTRPAIIAMARAARVSVGWLAAGSEMEFGAGKWEVAESYPRYAGDDLTKDYILVPCHELAVGDGVVLRSGQVVDHLAFKIAWVKGELGVDPRNLALIAVKDDAMMPALHQGDLLLLDLSQRQVRADAIYVLAVDDMLFARRIQRLVDGALCVRSDNPVYKEQIVPREAADSLHILGQVAWTGRRI